MVATRGTEEVVKFVIGKEQIPVSEIPPEAWPAIIRSEAETLPINYLRGFKGITETLQHNPTHSGDIARTVPEALYRYCSGASGVALSHSAVFLKCAERTNPEFPSAWHKAPRSQRPNPLGCTFFDLMRITSENLLLSRTKKFYLLHTEWIPRERWDKGSMASRPYEFRYELDIRADVFYIRDMPDEDLASWLAPKEDDQYPPIPVKVLLSFSIALGETTNALRHQFEYVLECENKRRETLVRMGFVV